MNSQVVHRNPCSCRIREQLQEAEETVQTVRGDNWRVRGSQGN